ncbi:hypothetical protein RFI_31391 [Reticulomyxa filosa]|uniref:Uncharacterized protein n=1 Tax=Reticulomyxa filosa TaxID=46433 RepID=X6LZ44_RETFI|nr:hypothetical protein RFI_31391 [Reticulomyxa filosa]|eukprot:ETO06005.1 hypothetical protein RFI_31391 [Reticulomyxa filosa]
MIIFAFIQKKAIIFSDFLIFYEGLFFFGQNQYLKFKCNNAKQLTMCNVHYVHKNLFYVHIFLHFCRRIHWRRGCLRASSMSRKFGLLDYLKKEEPNHICRSRIFLKKDNFFTFREKKLFKKKKVNNITVNIHFKSTYTFQLCVTKLVSEMKCCQISTTIYF